MSNKRETYLMRLSWAGTRSAKNAMPWGPGVRNCYILHYVLSGSGYIEMVGKKHRITAGQSFIIYPDTLVYYYPDKDDPWELIWVDFKGEEVEELLERTRFLPESPVAPIFRDELKNLYYDTYNDYEYNHINSCAGTGHLHLLLAYYLKYFAGFQKRNDFKSVIEYIERNCHNRHLTVSSISEAFNIDRATLYRRFKTHYSCSPNQYIFNRRMRRAQSLLIETSLPIKDIAFSVGYKNPLYFSTKFKETFGVSPSEYRKSKFSHSDL